MADAALPTIEAKLVLLGSSGVGKTSVVLRYVERVYSTDQPSTIGASFMTKRLVKDGVKIKLQIWDTAGQERFRSMTPMYYRGASAAVLVYDITDLDSFENVKDWVNELKSQVQHEIVLAIAGNKSDCAEKRQVVRANAEEYAASVGALHVETSAKTANDVDLLFDKVASELLVNYRKKKREGGAVGGGAAGASGVRLGDKGNNSKGGCC